MWAYSTSLYWQPSCLYPPIRWYHIPRHYNVAYFVIIYFHSPILRIRVPSPITYNTLDTVSFCHHNNCLHMGHTCISEGLVCYWEYHCPISLPYPYLYLPSFPEACLPDQYTTVSLTNLSTDNLTIHYWRYLDRRDYSWGDSYQYSLHFHILRYNAPDAPLYSYYVYLYYQNGLPPVTL